MTCPICKGRKVTSHRGAPRSIKACWGCSGKGVVSGTRYDFLAEQPRALVPKEES